MRSIAASTRLRTPAAKVRTLSLMTASSGITFSLVPACNAPTVTAAGSSGPTSRDTTVCRRITVAAAMTTGSMLACGIDPCAPRPNRRICRLSAATVMAPARPPMSPAGPTITCWPSTMPGLGKRANSPSPGMARAPSAVSSAGLPAGKQPTFAARDSEIPPKCRALVSDRFQPVTTEDVSGAIHVRSSENGWMNAFTRIYLLRWTSIQSRAPDALIVGRSGQAATDPSEVASARPQYRHRAICAGHITNTQPGSCS